MKKEQKLKMIDNLFSMEYCAQGLSRGTLEVINILKAELEELRKSTKLSAASVQNVTASILLTDNIALMLQNQQDFYRRLIIFLTSEFGDDIVTKLDELEAETKKVFESEEVVKTIDRVADTIEKATRSEDVVTNNNIFNKPDKKLN